jgi:hypothetical protein
VMIAAGKGVDGAVRAIGVSLAPTSDGRRATEA